MNNFTGNRNFTDLKIWNHLYIRSRSMNLPLTDPFATAENIRLFRLFYNCDVIFLTFMAQPYSSGDVKSLHFCKIANACRFNAGF
jgi:hypothetical protein